MAILRVKDADGNYIPIPAIKGDKGDRGELPFGEVTVEVINDVPTVTQWTPLPVPPAPEPEPTEEEVTLDLLAEHEERICMLELMNL